MTSIDKNKLKVEGREMYYAFSHLKQYKGRSLVFPTRKDYVILAKSLDLPIDYVSKRIEAFLFD
jgi:hypothetical protein